MKKHKLLISALCVSMAVAQIPLGVFAASSDPSDLVTDIMEPAQAESEEIVETAGTEGVTESCEIGDESLVCEDYSNYLTDRVEADNDEDDEK